jgi:hypothetical protein
MLLHLDGKYWSCPQFGSYSNQAAVHARARILVVPVVAAPGREKGESHPKPLLITPKTQKENHFIPRACVGVGVLVPPREVNTV